MIKTGTSFIRLLAGLCIASNFVHASQLTFTDTWKDTEVRTTTDQYGYTYSYFSVHTMGSFSASLSLPLDGVDLSEADAGTQLTFAVGPAGNTTTIVSDTLGDARNYSPGKKSATFPLMDPNSGNTVGNVTVSWTATTISVTATASEDILGEEQIFSGASDGVPTNTTLNTAATGVYYEVAVTLDASDNGGGTYNYDNPYVPVVGNDRETESSTNNGASPAPLESGSVTGTGDFTPPALKISSPPAGSKVYDANPVVDLTGIASDSEGITNIQCFVNGDTDTPVEIDQSGDFPTNHISWTAEVDLSQLGQVGSNLVTVMAGDLSGNQVSISRVFYWVETDSAALTVSPAAAGTIKGITEGQVLQKGASYKVTATPAGKEWIFSQWTDDLGDVLSSNATFEYIDTDGVLTANFETNFFYNTPLAGAYTGLFYDATNGVQLDDTGYVTITVTPTGGYSGKLNLATTASPFSISGQLAEAPGNLAAGASFSIKVSKSAYLNVNLLVATDTNLTDPGAGALSGFVNAFSDPTETNEIDSAGIQGALSLYNAGTLPGRYNVIISPVSTDPSQGPGGYSYGSATVSKKGAVALVLNLADGTSPAISFPSSLAQNGAAPFYASLYSGKGVILGWMQFLTDGSGKMQSQVINWVKLPVADKFYTDGFDATNAAVPAAISGGLYVPPKPGTNIFGATALTFEVDSGYTGLSLPDETDVSVMFNPVNNTFSDTGKVTITLTPATGALTGAFYPALSKKSLTFHGAQADDAGYGFYVGTNKETGPVWLGVPVTP